MDISVILNSYNLSAYIQDAVQSLLTQDYTGAFEIIVVDDASTDNTKEILSAIKHPNLTVIYLKENSGARHATELAFAKSKGQYVCRFDADDKWPSFFLSKAVAILNQHPEVDMVYGDCSFLDALGNITSVSNNIDRTAKHKPILEEEFVHILRNYYINAPTVMFRRTAFEKVLPMPVHLTNFIDLYISLSVLQKGKAWYIHQPIAYYRIHNTNMHRQQVSNKMGETVTKFIMQTFVQDNTKLPSKFKKELMAHNYFVLGEKYFGVGLWNDAKRLYRESLVASYTSWRNITLWKHLLGARFPQLYHKLQSV